MKRMKSKRLTCGIAVLLALSVSQAMAAPGYYREPVLHCLLYTSDAADE